MTTGAELAERRRKLGLSLEDVSAWTKIKVERLSAIERMDVAELPSLIYLKGFLRAYATELELAPDDLVERYLAELSIVEPAAPIAADLAAAAVPEDQAQLIEEPVPEPEGRRLKELEPVEPAIDPVAPHESSFFEVYDDRGGHEIDNAPRGRQLTASSRASRYVPMLIGALVAVVVGVLLAGNFETIRRRFTQATDVAPTRQAAPARLTDDAARIDTREPAARQNRGSAPDAARTTAPDSTRADLPDTTRAPDADRARATAPVADDASDPARKAPVENAARASSDDLSGSWTLTNRVESASLDAYENLNLGFRLQLQQRGNRITGSGHKWMENGRPVSARARTPISVEGTREGNRVELRFTERGAQRTSAGTFVLDVADDGTLRGTFASDAANARGESFAKRVISPQ